MVERNDRQDIASTFTNIPESISNSKYLYVRHARSEGNERCRTEGVAAYFDISLKDAPLSAGGIQECLNSITK